MCYNSWYLCSEYKKKNCFTFGKQSKTAIILKHESPFTMNEINRRNWSITFGNINWKMIIFHQILKMSLILFLLLAGDWLVSKLCIDKSHVYDNHCEWIRYHKNITLDNYCILNLKLYSLPITQRRFERESNSYKEILCSLPNIDMCWLI